MDNDSTDTRAGGKPSDPMIERLLERSLEEQKKSRNWGVFFKALTFAYVTVFLLALWPIFTGFSLPAGGEEHVAVIDVKGVIAADEPANANALAGALRSAFEAEHSKAILLLINSPGGSPVQAGQVFDEIKRLRQLHPDKKVYASIAELGASGAYYIAAAADEIYADKASLVGSIGVVGSGFGFVGLIEKLGIERRQYTAGSHKGFLDPFLPAKEDETAFWKEVLQITHKQFEAVVREGRGDRLKETDEMFSGLIWSGEQALDMGLIDGLGSAGFVSRDVIGVETMVDYTRRPNPLQEALKGFGVSIGQGIVRQSLQERVPEIR